MRSSIFFSSRRAAARPRPISGLAAYAIALRRLRGSGMLGAGVSVIMRYTLRLLDARPALPRGRPRLRARADPHPRCGGRVSVLAIGRSRSAFGSAAAASPNRMKPRPGTTDATAATTWLHRYQERPRPIAGAAQGVSLVLNAVHARTRFWIAPNRTVARQPRHQVRESRLPFHPRPRAAHPDRRRADLPAAPGVSDRHSRQVCSASLDRTERRLLRATWIVAMPNVAFSVRPSPVRAARSTTATGSIRPI